MLGCLQHALQGTASGQSTVQGTLYHDVKLAGTTSGAATVSGALSFQHLILLSGVPSEEAVGTPTLKVNQITPVGIPSEEQVGIPSVNRRQVSPPGVPSEEAVGTPALAASLDWWSNQYRYRRPLLVNAPSLESLPVGHRIDAYLDIDPFAQGKARSDAADLELVLLNDGVWVRVPRLIEEVDGILHISFLVQKQILAGDETTYHLYYGDPGATGVGRASFVDNPWPIHVSADSPFIDYTDPTEQWVDGRSQRALATATFEFTGTALRLTMYSGPAYGRGEIQIDEGDWGAVNFYSTVETPDVFMWMGLSPQSHKVRIRALGQLDPSALTDAISIQGYDYVAPYAVFDVGEEVLADEWNALVMVGDE